MMKGCLKFAVTLMFITTSIITYADAPPSISRDMYVCSVKNANTGEMFYGKSIKESYAQMYARATCQMKSHSGNCMVKASCEYLSRPLAASAE